MAADPAEKAAALQREKSLLYVSMTRARERLYVTWTGTRSEFLHSLAGD
jgi:superfamily I DNA/RNA helicase